MSTLAELDQQVADIRQVVLADRDFRLSETTLRAWFVGQILPVFVSKGETGEDDVATAIWYADEAIRQLKQ